MKAVLTSSATVTESTTDHGSVAVVRHIATASAPAGDCGEGETAPPQSSAAGVLGGVLAALKSGTAAPGEPHTAVERW